MDALRIPTDNLVSRQTFRLLANGVPCRNPLEGGKNSVLLFHDRAILRCAGKDTLWLALVRVTRTTPPSAFAWTGSPEGIDLHREPGGRSHQADAVRGEANRAKRRLVRLTFASWNRVLEWLRQVDGFRQAA